VSDFVSRMAARLVGDAVVAQPRLRGLFESADPASELEVVDEEVVARSSREAAATLLPATVPPAAPSARPASEAPTPPAPAAAAPRVEARPAAAAPEEDDPAPEAVPAVPRAEPPPATPAAAGPEAEPAPPHVTVVAVPASPVLPMHVPVPEAAVPAERDAEPEELQPVRVHIGRLEVRASLEEQARPRREPEERPVTGLALADYLRGERETA
jgi:hypothetical protein